MAQPTPYNRQFNFADQQALTPSAPLPATQVDAELNSVKLTLDQTLTNLAKIQRDDGALRNGIVTQDSLSDSLSIGFTLRGEWQEGVNYYLSDGVTVGSKFYRATASALSTAGNAPGQPDAPWLQVADFTEATSEAAASAAAALASENAAAGSASAAASSASAAGSSAGAASGSASGAAASASDASDSADAAAASAAEAANLIGGTVTQAVRWDTPQSLTAPQKTQARDNIGVEQSIVDNAVGADYASRATIAELSFPATRNSLRTAGYAAEGDGGGANYKRAASEPAHAGKVQSADGAWWEMYEATVTPMMFGAFGGLRSVAYTSLPNDAVALQGMLDYLSYSGGRITAPSHLHFRTDTKLQLRVTRRQLPPAVADSTIHFMDVTRFMFEPLGDLMLNAGAAMDAIIELIYYTPLSNIAPFYTTIANLRLRGNGLATYCFQSNYCMHVTLKNCDMDGSTSHCANWIGYGVARIVSNVFKGSKGLRLVEGGGDSLVEHNDFFPTANSSECITVGSLGGNSEIRKNVFSGVGATGIIGIRLINSGPNAPTDSIRHVTIEDNEFSGCGYGVHATKSTGKRIYGIVIEKNHVTPSGGGAVHTGVIALLDGVDDSTVKGNFGNTRNQLPASSGPFVLLNCNNVEVSGNKLVNYVGAALYLNNCTFCQFNQNLIQDCARGGAGSPIVDLDGASTDNDLMGNIFNQTSASFGQLGIYERTGATRNYGNDNRWQNVATPSTLAAGSASAFKLR